MSSSTVIGLVNNAALLLALGLLYDALGPRARGAKPTIQQAITGLILGGIGIAVMLNPWQFTPGVIFDTRSVLLSVSGLFFGTLPTLLAALMTAGLRLYQGGAGAWTGVAVIVTSGAIGVAWRHLRRRELDDMSVGELYLMGLVVHVAMLLWMFSLPWPLPLDVLSKISLPVMVIYPLATAALGWLMVNRGARWRAEEALRESEDRYRRLAEGTFEGIVLTEKGVFLDANRQFARMFGYEPAELTGKSVMELVAPQDREFVMRNIQAGYDKPYQHRALRKDGTEIIVEVHGQATMYQGRPVRMTAIHDITERVRAEEALKEYSERLEEMVEQRTAELNRRVEEVERLNRAMANMLEDLQMANHISQETARRLEEANAELESFAYSVSHDLRAPLRAMQGFGQALLEDYAGQLDPVGQDYTRRIVDAAQRMDLLIQDLLAYSRISRAEITLRSVSLEEVVEEALAHLETEIQGEEAKIAVEKPLPQVRGHPATLLQVVENLLSNALKFVAPGVRPQVRVWAETIPDQETATVPQSATGTEPSRSARNRQWIRLWVEDNGIGIAPEHQERIFRVFERLHGIEVYPGTGIGLAIVNKAMERMGGRVGVESQVGQGGRFWIELRKGE